MIIRSLLLLSALFSVITSLPLASVASADVHSTDMDPSMPPMSDINLPVDSPPSDLTSTDDTAPIYTNDSPQAVDTSNTSSDTPDTPDTTQDTPIDTTDTRFQDTRSAPQRDTNS